MTAEIFTRQGFEALVSGLQSTSLARQWGDASVGKVGGKVFAMLHPDRAPPALSFKCSQLAFEMLPTLEHCQPAPYLARARWVQVEDGAPLAGSELAAYVTEAHRLVAQMLPRRLQAELGLAGTVRVSPRRS
jgi:predicted DNA-binding protein (MmcQ/YjbR family)